jgi:DNA processing protein
MEVWRRGVAPYPESLLALPDPPKVLYAEGRADTLDRPCIAVVGTRRPTPYGERVTRGIAVALARGGACVVSGLAFGVDTVAHRAALDAGGATCAVLGTGVDVSYPRPHAHIQSTISERGLLLTEYPPGTGARRWSFPRRNRIIAGLSHLVIVVEAARASGALITARVALDLGREVAAVPGPIDAPASQGSNALIRDGACIVADALDVMVLAGLTTTRGGGAPLAGEERIVWDALGDGRLSAEMAAVRSRLPTPRCLAALTALELAGLITGTADGTYGRA